MRSTKLFPLALGLSLFTFGCDPDEAQDALSASGTIEATEVRVTARTPGEIVELLVEEGSLVNAGDTVAIVDHDMLALQLRQAEAGSRVAQAQLALLRSGARQEDIGQARAGLRQAEEQHALALKDAERIRALFEAGSTTRKMLDDVETRLSVAEAAVDAARQQVAKLENLARPEELATAEAQVGQSVAAADVLRRQIEDAFIISPLNGVVTEKPAELGEAVGQGTPIARISRLDEVYLRIYIPEPYLGRIRLGQSVDVFTDAYPDRSRAGRITFIAPEAEFTPKNVQTREERIKLVYEVKVAIPNEDGMLKPGMYADARIQFDGASTPETTER